MIASEWDADYVGREVVIHINDMPKIWSDRWSPAESDEEKRVRGRILHVNKDDYVVSFDTRACAGSGMTEVDIDSVPRKHAEVIHPDDTTVNDHIAWTTAVREEWRATPEHERALKPISLYEGVCVSKDAEAYLESVQGAYRKTRCGELSSHDFPKDFRARCDATSIVMRHGMHHTYWPLFRIFKLGPGNPAYDSEKESFGLRSATAEEGGRVIPKGAIVLLYSGMLRTSGESLALQLERKNDYVLGVYDKEESLVIDGAFGPNGNGRCKASFINDFRSFDADSCQREPNCRFVRLECGGCPAIRDKKHPHSFVRLTADLQPGQEVLIDYGKAYWDDNSVNARKCVQQADRKPSGKPSGKKPLPPDSPTAALAPENSMSEEIQPSDSEPAVSMPDVQICAFGIKEGLPQCDRVTESRREFCLRHMKFVTRLADTANGARWRDIAEKTVQSPLRQQRAKLKLKLPATPASVPVPAPDPAPVPTASPAESPPESPEVTPAPASYSRATPRAMPAPWGFSRFKRSAVHVKYNGHVPLEGVLDALKRSVDPFFNSSLAVLKCYSIVHERADAEHPEGSTLAAAVFEGCLNLGAHKPRVWDVGNVRPVVLLVSGSHWVEPTDLAVQTFCVIHDGHKKLLDNVTREEHLLYQGPGASVREPRARACNAAASPEAPSEPPVQTPTAPSEPPVQKPAAPSEPPVQTPAAPSEPPVQTPVQTPVPTDPVDASTPSLTPAKLLEMLTPEVKNGILTLLSAAAAAAAPAKPVMRDASTMTQTSPIAFLREALDTMETVAKTFQKPGDIVRQTTKHLPQNHYTSKMLQRKPLPAPAIAYLNRLLEIKSGSSTTNRPGCNDYARRIADSNVAVSFSVINSPELAGLTPAVFDKIFARMIAHTGGVKSQALREWIAKDGGVAPTLFKKRTLSEAGLEDVAPTPFKKRTLSEAELADVAPTPTKKRTLSQAGLGGDDKE